MPKTPKRPKKQHPLQWVFEPLMDDPSYIQKAMFGCQACYLHGRLMLVLAAGEEPWNGILVATSHEHHMSLRESYHGIMQHPVLKKWLYLPMVAEDFETVAMEMVEAVMAGDKRIGVEPKERKKQRNL